MAASKNSILIRKLTYIAILTALVVVLQTVFAPLIGAATGGISPALVLIPIVLGVSTCGLWAGAWLGAAFSLIVILDPTTVSFLEYNAVLTFLLVFVKGVGAPLVAGLLFNLIKKKNRYVAVIIAALALPVVNTGIFYLGCFLFFWEMTGMGLFTTLALINFLLEIAINIVFSPIIYRILEVCNLKV